MPRQRSLFVFGNDALEVRPSLNIEVVHAQRSFYFPNKSILALKRVAPFPLNHPTGARNPARRRIFTRRDPPIAPCTLPAIGTRRYGFRGGRGKCALALFPFAPRVGIKSSLSTNILIPPHGRCFPVSEPTYNFILTLLGGGAQPNKELVRFFYAAPLPFLNSPKRARTWVFGALRIPYGV